MDAFWVLKIHIIFLICLIDSLRLAIVDNLLDLGGVDLLTLLIAHSSVFVG